MREGLPEYFRYHFYLIRLVCMRRTFQCAGMKVKLIPAIHKSPTKNRISYVLFCFTQYLDAAPKLTGCLDNLMDSQNISTTVYFSIRLLQKVFWPVFPFYRQNLTRKIVQKSFLRMGFGLYF